MVLRTKQPGSSKWLDKALHPSAAAPAHVDPTVVPPVITFDHQLVLVLRSPSVKHINTRCIFEHVLVIVLRDKQT